MQTTARVGRDWAPALPGALIVRLFGCHRADLSRGRALSGAQSYRAQDSNLDLYGSEPSVVPSWTSPVCVSQRVSQSADVGRPGIEPGGPTRGEGSTGPPVSIAVYRPGSGCADKRKGHRGAAQVALRGAEMVISSYWRRASWSLKSLPKPRTLAPSIVGKDRPDIAQAAAWCVVGR